MADDRHTAEHGNYTLRPRKPCMQWFHTLHHNDWYRIPHVYFHANRLLSDAGSSAMITTSISGADPGVPEGRGFKDEFSN